MCVFYGKTILFLGFNPFTDIIVFRMLLCSNITPIVQLNAFLLYFQMDKIIQKIAVSTSSKEECLNSSHRKYKNQK